MSPSRNCKSVHRYLHFAPLTNMMVIKAFFAHLSIMLSSHAPIFDTSIIHPPFSMFADHIFLILWTCHSI